MTTQQVAEMFLWLWCDWHHGLHMAINPGELCSVVQCGPVAMAQCGWPVLFDYDLDTKITLRDFAIFGNRLSEFPRPPSTKPVVKALMIQECMTGPLGQGPFAFSPVDGLQPCSTFDADGDWDVDLKDVAHHQNARKK